MAVEEGHGLLSASGAKRWIACPPSCRLGEKVAHKASKYAEEGSVAHALAEYKLTGNKARKDLKAIKDNPLYGGKEMEKFVQTYVDYCRSFIKPGSIVEVEKQIDLSWLYPAEAPENEFKCGTGDFCVLWPEEGILHVIDLKYGMGVKVDANDNPQLKCYGYGTALDMGRLISIKEVHLHIVQPRLDHVSTWAISTEDLTSWAVEVAIPAGSKAYKGEGTYSPSPDTCKFCPAKGVCRAQADYSMSLAQADFIDYALLTPEEAGEYLDRIPMFRQWAEGLEQWVFSTLQKGIKVPGWKIVEAKTSRVITDIPGVQSVLALNGYADTAYMNYPPAKLKSITELEKLLTKNRFNELCGSFVTKPKGGPKLAPESDPSPAFSTIEEDFNKFKQD